MAAPDTKFIWDDQSQIHINSAIGPDHLDRPVFMTVFSSDKGPEEFQKELSGKDFFALYGENPNFFKHGQPLLQAANIANSGGLQYCKRVVAPDSKLAHLALVATVSASQVQKTNEQGRPLYWKTEDNLYWTKSNLEDLNEKYLSVSTEISEGWKEIEVDELPVDESFWKKTTSQAAKTAIGEEHELTEIEEFSPTKAYNPIGSNALAKIVKVTSDSTVVYYTVVKAVAGNNPAQVPGYIPVPATYEDETSYKKNDIVTYQSKYYKYTDSVNGKKLTVTEEFEASEELKPYDASSAYELNTAVSYNSSYYVCTLPYDPKKVPEDADTTPGTKRKTQTVDAKSDGTSNDKVMIDSAKIKYSLVSLPDEKQVNDTMFFKDVQNSIFSGLEAYKNELVPTVPNAKNYILFAITDNGRGISKKKIRLFADTSTRRPVKYIKYVLKVLENNEELENHYFTFDDLIVESPDGTNARLRNKSIEQVVNQDSKNIGCTAYNNQFDMFIADVASKCGIAEEELRYDDVLFGFDRYGHSINSIEIDPVGTELNTIGGIELKGGSNGSFGVAPIQLEANSDWASNGHPGITPMNPYFNEVLKVFDGSFADDIYDLDNTQIHVIFDANYPIEIKKAIEELVTFREDCFFFRDFGLGNTTIQEIASLNSSFSANKFVANYINNFDTIEPYYRKQVNVTIMNSLVTKFTNHYLNGVNRPFCGQAYDVTFENEIVPGTLNYSPKRTPKTDENILTYDQKQYFDDNRLNYIAVYSGIPTMDVEYTSQEQYTQLSWINNMLLIQKIIHEIRRQCPKDRYLFMDGQDLIRYKSDVEAVLNKHKGIFKSIGIEYVEDSNYELNKIFYAVIKVTFKDFIQSEIFKLTVIN